MADDVKNQLLPKEMKIIKLKKAIYDMHIKYGATEDQANLFML